MLNQFLRFRLASLKDIYRETIAAKGLNYDEQQITVVPHFLPSSTISIDWGTRYKPLIHRGNDTPPASRSVKLSPSNQTGVREKPKATASFLLSSEGTSRLVLALRQ